MEEQIARTLINEAVLELGKVTSTRAAVLDRHIKTIKRSVDLTRVPAATRFQVQLLEWGAEQESLAVASAGTPVWQYATGPDVLLSQIETALQGLIDDKRTNDSGPHHDMQALLDQASTYLFDFEVSLPEVTSHRPSHDLELHAVEPDQARAAPLISYRPPLSDQSAGVCTLNLTRISRAELEAATYACTIPGHHLIPTTPLNAVVPVPAYSEGWALYSTGLPAALGYYSGSGAGHGQQSLLTRALTQALIDIGIHFKQWNRATAIEKIAAQAPVSRAEAETMADYVLANPGKSIAPALGLLHFKRQREASEQALGSEFNLREFHDTVLKYGPLPLPLIEQNVQAWVLSKKPVAQ